MSAAHHTPDHHSVPHLPDRLIVAGPAALAAALPYLVDRSLAGCAVIAIFDGRTMLHSLALRDLPDHPAGASPEVRQRWADDVGTMLSQGLRAAAVRDGEPVAVAVYLPETFPGLPDWMAARVRPHLRVATNLLDAIAVTRGNWTSFLCSDVSCCPAEGRPIMADPAAVAVAAELVGAGLTAGPGRRDPGAEASRPVIGAVDSGHVGALLSALPLPTTASARGKLLERTWPRVSGGPGEPLSVREAADLILAADRPGVRDAILTRMARAGDLQEGWWPGQEALWRALADSAPADWASGPLCLVAVACWAQRDTHGAMLALDRAGEVDPGHRMARLIGRLVATGTPADTWFARMADIAEADCLAFDRPRPKRGRAARSAGA